MCILQHRTPRTPGSRPKSIPLNWKNAISTCCQYSIYLLAYLYTHKCVRSGFKYAHVQVNFAMHGHFIPHWFTSENSIVLVNRMRSGTNWISSRWMNIEQYSINFCIGWIQFVDCMIFWVKKIRAENFSRIGLICKCSWSFTQLRMKNEYRVTHVVAGSVFFWRKIESRWNIDQLTLRSTHDFVILTHKHTFIFIR